MVTVALAAWNWLRPYEGKPDPGARAEIVGVELRRDHSFYWVTAHVRATGAEGIDFAKPARLIVDGGRVLVPADTRLAGGADSGFREAWLQFWLEESDLKATLALALHDGKLTLKSEQEAPVLKHGEVRHFTTHRW